MGKVLTLFSVALVFISVAFPIFLSEVIGGWTKKYTSPVFFRPSHIPDLSGKVAIVTGSNTGIGYETALELARAGSTVVLAARSESKGNAAVERIRNEVGEKAQLHFLQLDLASLKSVSKFAQSFLKMNLPLDILILNAGVMKSPGQMYIGQSLNYGFETTEDGFEYHIGVNHIGHVHLTNLLLNKLKKSSPSRIISVSSSAEMSAPESGMKFVDWNPKDGKMPATYEDGEGYGQSKLANLMYTKELASHLNGTGVTAYAVHPGVITTELGRYMTPVLEKDLQSKDIVQRMIGTFFSMLFTSSLLDVPGGALAQLHLASAPIDDLVNGGFYHPIGKHVLPSHPQASNETLAKMLWVETDRAIKMKSNYKYN